MAARFEMVEKMEAAVQPAVINAFGASQHRVDAAAASMSVQQAVASIHRVDLGNPWITHRSSVRVVLVVEGFLFQKNGMCSTDRPPQRPQTSD